ncbi:hypothetical protein NK718_21315 [Alsobacter sp. SYSU M60028]|uniref:Uncharacterized protein n=1 Tax=Alsobacter ponti TaxID=2962936 RepID=A0ABT1LHU3_9HYPH|nr:hypothetical protein [Alsobacter ponti]MCP8941069.1 hypothetical protein [Alsobacter ponti]
MAKKKDRGDSEFVLFNVLYEDGSRSSNRRVPRADLGGLDGDEPARAAIEAQDRDIAARSGRPRGRIKTIERA